MCSGNSKLDVALMQTISDLRKHLKRSGQEIPSLQPSEAVYHFKTKGDGSTLRKKLTGVLQDPSDFPVLANELFVPYGMSIAMVAFPQEAIGTATVNAYSKGEVRTNTEDTTIFGAIGSKELRGYYNGATFTWNVQNVDCLRDIPMSIFHKVQTSAGAAQYVAYDGSDFQLGHIRIPALAGNVDTTMSITPSQNQIWTGASVNNNTTFFALRVRLHGVRVRFATNDEATAAAKTFNAIYGFNTAIG